MPSQSRPNALFLQMGSMIYDNDASISVLDVRCRLYLSELVTHYGASLDSFAIVVPNLAFYHTHITEIENKKVPVIGLSCPPELKRHPDFQRYIAYIKRNMASGRTLCILDDEVKENPFQVGDWRELSDQEIDTFLNRLENKKQVTFTSVRQLTFFSPGDSPSKLHLRLKTQKQSREHLVVHRSQSRILPWEQALIANRAEVSGSEQTRKPALPPCARGHMPRR